MAALGALVTALAACVLAVEGQQHQQQQQQQQQREDAATEAARSAMARAVNAFSTDLYQRAGRAPGNAVLSPLSASVLLALTWEGSAGATAQQLARALHLPPEQHSVAEGNRALVHSLQTTTRPNQEVILRFANKLYAQRGFRLKGDFRSKASRSYGADAEELDFSQDAESARRVINGWVEEYTAAKIKDLFPKGSPSSSSRLVLVNAVYLKADWLKPFNKDQTEMNPFYLSSNSAVNVPMMHKSSEFLFANISELSATALQLPVEDGRGLKMVFVLPNSVDGLPQLEANLQHLNFNAIPWEKRTVNVSLPKFHIEATHNLDKLLQELGVNDLFTKNANLSGIADEGLFVSKAVQKTFIDVNENGIEAAAASGTDFVYFSIPPPPADFRANHPFFFFIIKTDVILFLGRVTDPRQK